MFNLQRLFTSYEFSGNLEFPEKILFVIFFLLLLQAVLEALSAGLLVPFLNSLQNVKGETSESDNKVRYINKKNWRALLGYVSQETFLFNETARNNLRFGFQKDINESELIDACKKAQIYETIMSFENKYDTVLGEKGVRLSGGKKQRLAIARPVSHESVNCSF